MILIAPIYLEAAILPHFLHHYSELGIREFHFAVNTKLNPKIVREVEEMSAGYPVHIDIVCEFDNESGAMAKKLNAIRKRCAEPEQWISVVDLDEFYELPSLRSKLLSPLSEFLELCEYYGYDHVRGRLIDRVANDGCFPELRSSPSLDQQYPLKRRLTRKLVGGDDRKVVLQKARFKIRGGHHSIRDGQSRADIELPVNHFKWKLGVVERLRRAVVLEKLGKPWADESRKFLTYINQHGRIDVNDRRFFLKDRKDSRNEFHR